MFNTKSVLIASATLAVFASCAADPVQRNPGTDSDSETGGEVMVDEEEVLARAADYMNTLVLLSDEPVQEETHADAAMIQVWGNAEAASAFASIDPADPTQIVEFDPGTMFVKENLDETGVPTGFTMMFKADPGYNPGGGDWYWATVADEITVESGKIPFCTSCHAAAMNTDFVVGFGKSP